MWTRRSRAFPLVLITDLGPDPDDAKALLVAATQHKRGRVSLRAVIANGGQQAQARARLARCLLDHVAASDVPVGAGEEGAQPYAPMPHEYLLSGYASVPDSAILRGAQLLERTLVAAAPHSLRIVCISSLRDLAEAIRARPDLVAGRVHTVAVQGGLERDPSAAHGWRADSSVNNGFDPEAAQAVYDFCFSRGVRLRVVSRHAVPMLPMQLAKSFAARTDCPVMRYLADAQHLGLEGLWRRLCAGELPARCTKQWYFETFCGVGGAEFERRGYASLDATAPIRDLLDGFVKPYDVLALMSVLPDISGTMEAEARPVRVPLGSGGGSGGAAGSRGAVSGGADAHLLYIGAEHTLELGHVLNALRDAYHDVVVLTRGTVALAASGAGAGARVGAGGGDDDAMGDWSTPSRRRARGAALPASHDRTRVASQLLVRPSEPSGDGARALSAAEIESQLEASVGSARRHLLGLSRAYSVAGVLLVAASSGGYLLDSEHTGRRHSGAPNASVLYELDDEFAARSHVYTLLVQAGVLVSLLALPCSDGMRARMLFFGGSVGTLAIFYGCLVYIPHLAVLLEKDPDSYQDPYSLADGGARPARVYHGAGVANAAGRIVEYVGLWAVMLLVLVPARWRSSARLLDALWTTTGLWTALHGLMDAYNVAWALVSGLAAVRSAWLYPIVGASSATSVAIGTCMLSAAFRRRARAAIAQAVASAGPAASIAPLLGYGDREREVDAAQLAREALRSFETASLDAQTLDALTEARMSSRDSLTALVRARRATRPARQPRLSPVPGGGSGSLIGSGGSSPSAASRWLAAASLRSSATVTPWDSVASLRKSPSPSSRFSRGSSSARLSPFAGSRLEQGSGVLSSRDSIGFASLRMSPGAGSRLERGSSAVSSRESFGSASVRPSPAAGARLERGSSAVSSRDSLSSMRSSAVAPRASTSRASPGVLGRRDSGPASADASARAPRAAAGGPRSPGAGVAAPSSALSLVESTARVGGARGAEAGGAAAELPVADAYVVHAREDSAAGRIAALRAWAAGFEAREGRPPRAWLDVLCADPSLLPIERLSHVPVYMARSRRLLLLAGPSVADRSRCVAEMYIWRAMGNRLEDVEVVSVSARGGGGGGGGGGAEGGAEDRGHALVSAIDTFHVMYATVEEDPAVREALKRTVELATISAFNRTVREYLPLSTPPLRSASEHVRARALLALGDEPPTTSGADGAGCEGGGCALASDVSARTESGAIAADDAGVRVAHAPGAALNGTEGDEGAAEAAAEADETLAAGGGAEAGAAPAEDATLGPAPSDERLEAALCLQRVGRDTQAFMRSPGTSSEKLGFAAVVLVAVAGSALIAGLVYRAGWRDARKKAAVQLGGALLASADGVTDLLLATEWLRCGHTVWAAIALSCVGLNTLAALIFGAARGFIPGEGSSLLARGGAAVSSVLQLGTVHAAVVRVWEGERARPVDAQSLVRLRLFEVALEAAPQVFVQGYVLLWLGAGRASALSWVSLAVSVAGMSLVLGDAHMRPAGGHGDGLEGLDWDGGGGTRRAARALGLFGVVSRALPIALFGCAFGNWLALLLPGAFAVLVALARFALQREEGCEAWAVAVASCLLLYAAAPMLELGDGTTTLGEARIVAWTAAVEFSLAATALGAPSAWRAAQPAGLLSGAACVFSMCWLGRLGAAAVLLRDKAQRYGEGLALLV